MDKFADVCKGDQYCLTMQQFMNEIVADMRDDIDKNTFRPIGPQKATEWLSTTDINNIMHQYEPIYPHFKFLGAVPQDCDELSFCQLFQINYDKFQKDGITQLGVIFNHDRHGQPGSHWVALFIDLAKCEIDYCDSMGKAPLGNIRNVIENFQKRCQNNHKHEAVFKWNTNRYQMDNSECGIYSCNFIIRRLSGEKFENIVAKTLDFNKINACRNVYFRNKPSKHAASDRCE